MAAQDSNSRTYQLEIYNVEVNVRPNEKVSRVVLSFGGTLSARAKKQMTDALKAGEFEIRQDRNQLA